MKADREGSAGTQLAALIEQDPQVLEDGLALHRAADMSALNVAAVYFGTDASDVSTAVVLFDDPASAAAVQDVLPKLDWPATGADASSGGGKAIGRRRVIFLAADYYEGFAAALARAADNQTRLEASRVWYRSLPDGDHAITVQPLRTEGAKGLRWGAVTEGARDAWRFLATPREPPAWLDPARKKVRDVLDAVERRGVSRRVVAYAVLGCMMLVYVWVFARLAVLRHDVFGTWAYDLGGWDQAIWAISRGRSLWSTIWGLNVFGDHLCLTIVLFAPLYWLWNDARIILIAQTVILALGALPLYWIAKDKLSGRWIALLFPFLYLMYPALQWTNWDEWHPDTLATPMLLFAFYFLSRKKYAPFALCAAIVLLTKEDFAFTVAALGIYVFFCCSKRWGAAVVAGSLAWFAVAVAILRAYNGIGVLRMGSLYGPLGGSLSEVATGVFTKPGLVASALLNPERLHYLFQLLGPVAFVSLFAPSVLLIALPVTMVNLLAASYQSSIVYHYTVLITPFVFIALVYAFAKVKPASYAKYLLVGVLLVASLVANVNWSPSPLSAHVGSWGTYDPRVAIYNEAVAHVPKDAVVSATYQFVPHLDHREWVYMWPNPFMRSYWGLDVAGLPPKELDRRSPLPDPKTVQYVLLEKQIVSADTSAIAASLTSSGQFVPVFERGSVVLLQRR